MQQDWPEEPIQQYYDCFEVNAATMACAERLLSHALNSEARLSDARPLWDAPDNCKKNVLRCRVSASDPVSPSTVILKRIATSRGMHDLDTISPDKLAWRLTSEWGGCQFLQSVTSEAPLSPICYGGDRAHCLLLLEDIGEGPHVIDILMDSDPIAAERALVGYVTTLGRMHAATMGCEADYDRILHGIAPRDTQIRLHDAQQVQLHLRRIEELLHLKNITLPSGLFHEAEEVFRALMEPGPFLAFTHGDPCPVNDMVCGDTVRLYDFEYSGYRHALMDGVFQRQLFQWARFRLPDSILERMEEAYRAELAARCPNAANNQRYQHEQTLTRAAWTMAILRTCLEDDMDHDGYGGWFEDLSDAEKAIVPTTRQRALLLLNDLALMTETAGLLPVLGATARQVARRLGTDWQVTTNPLPLYPAFAQGGLLTNV